MLMTMRLVGGQAEVGEPDGQLAGVVGRISTFSGAKLQDERLGKPAQERVTNMGAGRLELFSGVTVTLSEPVCPAVSVMGSDDGETGVRESWNPGVVLAVWAWIVACVDIEDWCVASPA